MTAPTHTPYADAASNRLYSMLFCDDLQAFAPDRGQTLAAWQAALFAQRPAAQAVRDLAHDAQQASRVRLLALHWLRSNGQPVVPRQLMGVVLEVPVNGGLDVLAVYGDGSVRYLNHAAPPIFIEGPLATLQPTVTRVLRASQHIVDHIGPWQGARLSAPRVNVRLSFLVSDGLYFGEGPMATLSKDAMAGPLLQAGGELLAQLTELACA